MNQDQSEITLEESVKEVMQTLPPVIRAYLSQRKYTMVTKSLMIKYGLRIDQGGILEREIMLLLMGIENPDEFTQALSEEAKLDKKTIENIAQDINTQIFMPLRERMRSGEVNTAPPAKPAVAMPGALAQGKNYAPPLQSPMYSRPINISPSASIPQKNFTRPTPNLAVKPPSNMPPTRLGMIAAPKSVDSGQLLEDHEELHIEFNKTPMPQTPSLATPPSPQFPQGINRVAAPVVQSAPIATKIKLVVPTIDPKPIPPFTPAASAPKTPPTHQKPYSTDPYREPIE